MKCTWTCPKCKKSIETMGSIEVAHRCPSNGRKMTQFHREQTNVN